MARTSYLPWTFAAAATGIAGYFAFPHVCLALAGLLLKHSFPQSCGSPKNSPFAWSFQNSEPCATVDESDRAVTAFRVSRLLRAAEARLGKTAQSIQVRARQLNALGNTAEAARLLSLASVLQPENSTIQLDYGISLAELGWRLDSPQLYVQALEEMLQASRRTGFPANGYIDIAVLAEQIPAPRAAVRYWEKAEALVSEQGAKRRIQSNLNRLRTLISSRSNLATQPLNAGQLASVPGYPELLLARTLGANQTSSQQELDWLKLAAFFAEKRQDRWLADMESAQTLPSMVRLRAAYRANLAGTHAEAITDAKAAISGFRTQRNAAGDIAARIELAIAHRRLYQTDLCLETIHGVEQEARERGYRWMALRAKSENIACRSQSRRFDVVGEREALAEDSVQSGFTDLHLRNIGGVVEPFHSYATPAISWKRGHDALQLFWRTPLPAVIASNLYLPLYMAAANEGLFEAAFVLVDEAQDVLQNAPNRRLHAQIVITAAKLLVRSGEISSAKQYLDRVQPNALGLEAKLLAADFKRNEGNHNEALRMLIAAMPREPNPYDRVNYLAALGRTQVDRGNLTAAAHAFRAVTGLSVADARAAKDPQQRYASILEGEAGWRGLVEVESRRGNHEAALAFWQMFRSGGEPYRKPGSDPHIAWISLASLPSGHVVWLSKGGRFHSHFVADHDRNLRNRVLTLAHLASDPESPREAIRDLAGVFGQALLGPLALELASASTFIIDADEDFAKLPWPLLELNGRPLVDSHALVLTHGWGEARTRLQQAMPAGVPQHPLLVRNATVGATVANQFPVLPSADHETARLRALAGVVELRGAEATVTAILDGLREADSFHFTGHGFTWGSAGALVVSPERQEQPFGVLAASEIRKRDWTHLRLVVLASCTSAGAELRANPNFESTARAFLEGGAKQVLASRWNIDSISTADIVESFYGSLAAGKTAATALQSAMLATKGRQETSHPYYWAGLALQGAL